MRKIRRFASTERRLFRRRSEAAGDARIPFVLEADRRPTGGKEGRNEWRKGRGVECKFKEHILGPYGV